MTLYAVILCAGFLNGPMRCAPPAGSSPQPLKECRKTVAKHQRATGAATVKLPNGLIAVRHWECAAKAGEQSTPAG